jgi:hypothetical protein
MVKKKRQAVKRPPSSGLEEIEARVSQLAKLAIGMSEDIEKLTQRVAELERSELLRQMPAIAGKSNEIQGGSRTYF